jgi:hypothetical protein
MANWKTKHSAPNDGKALPAFNLLLVSKLSVTVPKAIY